MLGYKLSSSQPSLVIQMWPFNPRVHPPHCCTWQDRARRVAGSSDRRSSAATVSAVYTPQSSCSSSESHRTQRSVCGCTARIWGGRTYSTTYWLDTVRRQAALNLFTAYSVWPSVPAFSTRVETRHTLVPTSQTPARSDQGRSIGFDKNKWLNTRKKEI